MKRIKKLLLSFITICMLIQYLPTKVQAVNNETVRETTNVNENMEIIGEDESLRESDTKHFRMSDGSMMAIDYGMPVHYEEDGEWKDIDNTPIIMMDDEDNEEYRIINGDYAFSFSENGYPYLYTAVYDDTILEVSLNEGFSDETETNITKKTNEQLPEDLITEITYKNIINDTDIRYTISGLDIKEDIIIHEPKDEYIYEFIIETENLGIRINNDDTISFMKDDIEIYHIPKMIMIDANYETCEVDHIIEESDEGILLKVQPDKEWIEDEERVFPITIDPTLINQVERSVNDTNADIYLAYVQQGSPDDDFDADTNLYLGYSSLSYVKEREAYFYVNRLPELPQGSVMVDAKIALYMIDYSQINCTSMPIGIYEANDTHGSKTYQNWIREMTWNTRAGFKEDNLLDYVRVGSSDVGKYHLWDISETAGKWYETQTTNRTLAMKGIGSYNNSKCAVPVFKAYGSNGPIMMVSYRSTTGIEPYYTYQSIDVKEAGTLYIADALGEIRVVKNLIHQASTINPVSLSLVYNSDYYKEDKNNEDDIQDKHDLDMEMGEGFKLDIIQSIEEVEINDETYLLYHDGDGTDHYFKKEENKYIDEDGLGLEASIISSSNKKYKIEDKSGNTMTFENGILTEMSDEIGNRIIIDHTTSDKGNWFRHIYQENINKERKTIATLGYEAGTSNVALITDASQKSYHFTYDEGRLKTISYDGEEIAEYHYDGNRLIGMSDIESGYVIWLNYENGKVSQIKEWIGKKTNGTWTYPDSGKTITTSFTKEKAEYRDWGNDQRENTNDDILTCYLFDEALRTINAYVKDDGWKIYGTSSTVYESELGKKNNRTLEIIKSGGRGIDLLTNGSFENGNWTMTSGMSISSDNPRSGNKSLKAVTTSTETFVMAQRDTFELSENKVYTVSGYVDTSGLSSIAGSVYLHVEDSTGNYKDSEEIDYKTNNGEWTRISLRFAAKTSGAHTISIRSRGNIGTFYVDDIQVEEGESASGHEMLENANLLTNTYGWTMGENAQYFYNGSSYYIKIASSPLDDMSQSGTSSAWQYVNINDTAKSYYLSGWAKGNSVRDNLDEGTKENDKNKSFGLRAIIYYSDGEVEYHYASFNADIEGWQYTGKAIVPKKNKNINMICIVCAYERNGNYVYFDDISLTQQPAQTMYYDDEGNLTSVKTNGQSDEKMTYDNSLIQSYTGGGNSFTYTYDETYEHRLKTISDSVLTQSMGYDSQSNVTETKLKGKGKKYLLQSSIYTSDANHVYKTTDVNDSHAWYYYEGAYNQMSGNPSRIEGYSSESSSTPQYIRNSLIYDSKGRLGQSIYTDYEDGTELGRVKYDYEKGQLKSIKRNNSQQYSFTYDDWSRVTAIKAADNLLISHEYDDNSNLTKTTYSNGETITYTYDNLGRVKTKTYSSGRILTYYYSQDGYLASVHDSKEGYEHYEYDSLGRLISTRKDVENVKDARSSYSYDTHSRVTRHDYDTKTSGHVYETYTYDSTDEDISNGTLIYMQMVSGNYLNYRYDELQRLTDKYIERGSNIDREIWERYTYNDEADTEGKTELKAGSQITKKEVWMENTSVLEYEYEYDRNGNIIKETDKKTNKVNEYTYDDLGQLIKVNDGIQTYTYDRYGNITSIKNGNDTLSLTYKTSGWMDQLATVGGHTIVYDNVGNPTTYYNGNSYTMEWTEGRKLSEVTIDNKTYEYEYDKSSTRAKKTLPDQTSIIYDIIEGEAVGERHYDANGNVTTYMRYTFDENHAINGIAIWDFTANKWKEYYFAKNLQGDVIKVYDASTNSCIASYSYDAWGNITSSSGSLAETNPFRYRGYYYDEETGLYYVSSRYYDPEIGRWINADNQIAGVGGEVLGYNMFAYCMNNPVNMSDPSGNWPRWATIALGAVAAVAAVAVTVVTLGAAAPAAVCTLTSVAMSVGVSYGVASAAATVAVAATTVAAAAYAGDIAYSAVTGDSLLLDTVFQGNTDAYNTGLAITSIATAGMLEAAAQSPGVCFVAGTPVLAVCGYIAIEEIKAGDMVWAENPETGEKELKEVVQTFVNETTELIYIQVGSEEIVTTPEHPFYSPVKGWIAACKLRAGDILVLQNGKYVTVEKVQHEILEAPITVYNFEVEDFHTYYVGKCAVLVHNTCGGNSSSRGVGGKGWVGDKTWRENVSTVGNGGTITSLNGGVPTKAQAMQLINQSGGTPLRIEGAHQFPNPHNYTHINYVTSSGVKGTIKIFE